MVMVLQRGCLCGNDLGKGEDSCRNGPQKEGSLEPYGLGKGLASLVDLLDIGCNLSSMLKWGNVMYCNIVYP